MKKRMFVIAAIALVLGSAAQAQLRKIPAEATEAFKNLYPQASHVEWKDKITAFAAEFVQDSVHYEARFNSKGEWTQTYHQIPIENMPGEVKVGYEKSKYLDWKVESITQVDLPGNKVQYLVLVSKSDIQKKNLLFSSTGRLLKDKITL